MKSSQKTVFVVVGPTAAGKTKVAIELASRLHTEIISADSRQCFKELKIGVARPTVEELSRIKHHFIASHSLHDPMNAGIYEHFALQAAKEIFRDHDHLVMVGGTGLYIKAFCEGLDEMPSVAPGVRKKIESEYNEKGLNWLQKKVEVKDPLFFATGEIKNPARLIRALEVVEATGQSILSFREGKKKIRDFRMVKFGVHLSKEQLIRNINARVDQMMADGLVHEAETLLPYKHLSALQTVGYSEIFNYLDGKCPLEEAGMLIKTNTRHLAKRQLTWFRKESLVRWDTPEGIISGYSNYFS